MQCTQMACSDGLSMFPCRSAHCLLQQNYKCHSGCGASSARWLWPRFYLEDPCWAAGSSIGTEIGSRRFLNPESKTLAGGVLTL